MFFVFIEKVIPNAKSVSWMKVLVSDSKHSAELVGWPEGVFFLENATGKGKELKIPFSKSTDGKTHFQLKLLGKQELLYIEKLFLNEILSFKLRCIE
jgi:hypothetical protein